MPARCPVSGLARRLRRDTRRRSQFRRAESEDREGDASLRIASIVQIAVARKLSNDVPNRLAVIDFESLPPWHVESLRIDA